VFTDLNLILNSRYFHRTYGLRDVVGLKLIEVSGVIELAW